MLAPLPLIFCLALMPAGTPDSVPLARAIDHDLQPLAKLAGSAQRKLGEGVGGMDEGAAQQVTGYAAGCCTANVVRMRERLAGLEQTAARLNRGYVERRSTNGQAIATEIATHVGAARQALEFFATAPDAATAGEALTRLQQLTVEINNDKKRLTSCCNELKLPPPPRD